MTSLELFAGAGGLALGTARAGFLAAAAVERDAACAETLRANGLPAVEADASAVDFSRWAGADLVSGGPPCFAKGTLVLAREGYKPIEEIAVGDEVLTHLGRWRQVTAVSFKQNAALRRVRAQGVVVTTTDEHPFWARTVKRSHNRRVRSFGDPRWVAAGELTRNHFLAQIIPEVKPDGRTAEFWWLVGRYLADGWRVWRKGRPGASRTVICCAHAEADELRERITAAGFHAYAPPVKRNTVSFQIYTNSLYRFLEPFGHLAHGKTLPGFALSLSRAKSVALLDGYMSGDGWAGLGFRRAETVSKRLAFGMALLAQRTGIVASVGQRIPPKTIVIEGRTVRRRPSWFVYVPKRNRSGFVDGRCGWKPVRESECHGRGTVYNLSVEGDESYMADGAVVHNCQPWSGAGQHAGQSDARDMFPTLIRAVREARPRLVLVENVKGLLRPKFGEYLRYIQRRHGRAGELR